ncbi:MmcQ/YjbR family DNA-binding protein [Paenibacillus naphthalenovorans]
MKLFRNTGIVILRIEAVHSDINKKGDLPPMDHQQLINYGLKKTGADLRYPFDPETPVLFVANKMFALFGSFQGTPSVNLKADPDTVWLTRQTYPKSVYPGYHMNKRHWNTVLLDGSIGDSEILDMLDESYQLVCSKLPKSEKQRLSLP